MISFKKNKFVTEYLLSFNATKAAIAAGYSRKTAYAIGSKLLKDSKVKEEINRLMTEQREVILLTRSERQKFWQDVMMNKENEMHDRMKASELLAKSFGDFDPQVIERERQKQLSTDERRKEEANLWCRY